CYHFARGRNPCRFASTLVNFMAKGRFSLFFDCLSIGNMRDAIANNILDEIEKLAQAKRLEFPDLELMQFINYLLQTLMRDALLLFNIISSHSVYFIISKSKQQQLFEEIGEKFYVVRLKNPLQGMFGELFKVHLVSSHLVLTLLQVKGSIPPLSDLTE
ncbi:hypothetical protein R6Q57_004962, partial [Mikania cordata]